MFGADSKHHNPKVDIPILVPTSVPDSTFEFNEDIPF
ncbi:Single-strand DNA binding protein [Borrelia duttonii CR2A]|uniref:Single-strand DNA binding protein n=1 Tax=Borrelia duttonii CR2A TaxID=1432657 RepID=W6TFG1_9SPIR|nr:Single-strand DNA binding protein [Borrelia duttonii CR2A]